MVRAWGLKRWRHFWYRSENNIILLFMPMASCSDLIKWTEDYFPLTLNKKTKGRLLVHVFKRLYFLVDWLHLQYYPDRYHCCSSCGWISAAGVTGGDSGVVWRWQHCLCAQGRRGTLLCHGAHPSVFWSWLVSGCVSQGFCRKQTAHLNQVIWGEIRGFFSKGESNVWYKEPTRLVPCPRVS